MALQACFPVPLWAEPEDHQRFAVALAALYHNKTGSVSALSQALGLSHATLSMALNGSGLSSQTCMALEALLGRETFPREFFRPDLFALVQE